MNREKWSPSTEEEDDLRQNLIASADPLLKEFTPEEAANAIIEAMREMPCHYLDWPNLFESLTLKNLNKIRTQKQRAASQRMNEEEQ